MNLPANTYTVWISLPNVGVVPAPGLFTVPLTVTNISPLRGSYAGALLEGPLGAALDAVSTQHHVVQEPLSQCAHLE